MLVVSNIKEVAQLQPLKRQLACYQRALPAIAVGCNRLLVQHVTGVNSRRVRITLQRGHAHVDMLEDEQDVYGISAA